MGHSNKKAPTLFFEKFLNAVKEKGLDEYQEILSPNGEYLSMHFGKKAEKIPGAPKKITYSTSIHLLELNKMDSGEKDTFFTRVLTEAVKAIEVELG